MDYNYLFFQPLNQEERSRLESVRLPNLFGHFMGRAAITPASVHFDSSSGKKTIFTVTDVTGEIISFEAGSNDPVKAAAELVFRTPYYINPKRRPV